MDIPETFLTWIIEQNLAQIDSLSFNRYRKVWNFFWIIDRITDLAEFLIFFTKTHHFYWNQIDKRPHTMWQHCDNIVTTLWQSVRVSLMVNYILLQLPGKMKGIPILSDHLKLRFIEGKVTERFFSDHQFMQEYKVWQPTSLLCSAMLFLFLISFALKNTAVAHSWLEPDLCVWLTQMVSNRKQWVYSSYAVHIIYICILQFYLCLCELLNSGKVRVFGLLQLSELEVTCFVKNVDLKCRSEAQNLKNKKGTFVKVKQVVQQAAENQIQTGDCWRKTHRQCNTNIELRQSDALKTHRDEMQTKNWHTQQKLQC